MFIYIFLNCQNKNNAKQQQGHKKNNNNKSKFGDDVSTLNLNGEVIPFPS